MTHPEELLAGYVDGTLTEKERGVVDAHLSTCQTCREELDLAARSASTLSAVPELPVPFGLTQRVVAESSRPTRRPERTPWIARVQWAAGLAAAAALVTVVALNLPNVTTKSQEAAPAAGLAPSRAPDAMKGTSTEPVAVEVQKIDYDEARVQQLASSVATTPSMAAVSPSGLGLEASTAALACISQGVGTGITSNDSLVRLIDATFHGTPAYLAVFLESPGADQPPAKVVVWIVGKNDCSTFLSYAYKRIAP